MVELLASLKSEGFKMLLTSAILLTRPIVLVVQKTYWLILFSLLNYLKIGLATGIHCTWCGWKNLFWLHMLIAEASAFATAGIWSNVLGQLWARFLSNSFELRSIDHASSLYTAKMVGILWFCYGCLTDVFRSTIVGITVFQAYRSKGEFDCSHLPHPRLIRMCYAN